MHRPNGRVRYSRSCRRGRRRSNRLELFNLRRRFWLQRAMRILIAQPLKQLNRAVLVALLAEALERLCRKRTGLPERVVREPTRWVALHEAPVAVDDHAEILNSC